MTEKIRCALYSIMGIALGIVLLLPGGHVQASEKKTIYNSSYVSFSPDGKAWTTCAGDRNYKWYDENHHTDVRRSQTISIGLPMMQMLSPAMGLWKKAIICMIMLYFMREKK